MNPSMALICACGECGIDPETWECESMRDGFAIYAAVAECHRRGATYARLPLCPDCLAAMGGPAEGRLPSRAAREGEACAADDHD